MPHIPAKNQTMFHTVFVILQVKYLPFPYAFAYFLCKGKAKETIKKIVQSKQNCNRVAVEQKYKNTI